MRKTFFPFWGLLVLLASSDNYINCNKNKEYIIWDENRKLEWKDFQSEDFAGMGVAATSSVKLRLDYQVLTSVLWYSVQCLFFKKESSVGLGKSDYILNHEQGHFDIGEIYARELRKEIQKIRNKINKKNSQKVDSVYDVVNEMFVNEQSLYDKETKQSTDTLQQKIWHLKIKKRLDSLQEFKKQKY